MRVCLTVDVEQDCPPFLDTFRGIEAGMPALLELLAAEGVRSTFFTTGDVARRYPALIDKLVDAGHELACHGDTHRRFDTLDPAEARAEIVAATATLSRHYPVISFRAPNLAFPLDYLPLLEESNYRLDSSQGRHKLDYWRYAQPATTLVRVPASTTSSVLRWQSLLRGLVFRALGDPVVLFVHPWEFVDFRRSNLRLDCRFKTGAVALECLRASIRFFRDRGGKFVRMRDLLDAPSGERASRTEGANRASRLDGAGSGSPLTRLDRRGRLGLK
jgi:peptidoglycan-N-acetylglucosamine deacetylase